MPCFYRILLPSPPHVTALFWAQPHINSADKEKGQSYHLCINQLIREVYGHSLSRGDVAAFVVDTRGRPLACAKELPE